MFFHAPYSHILAREDMTLAKSVGQSGVGVFYLKGSMWRQAEGKPNPALLPLPGHVPMGYPKGIPLQGAALLDVSVAQRKAFRQFKGRADGETWAVFSPL